MKNSCLVTLSAALVLVLFLSTAPNVFCYSSDNSWSPLAVMPTARSDLGVATVDGKIFAIGGKGGGYLSTNEMYDPTTDTWTPKADMPTARADFGIAVYEGKIYCIGGTHMQGTHLEAIAVVEAYDTKTDTWQTKTPMPTNRTTTTANTVDGKIYAIGGTKSLYLPDYSNTTEEYDPQTDTWSTKKSAPTPVAYHTSAVYNNEIYIIGGTSGNALQVYNPKNDEWLQKASVPISENLVESAAAVTVGSHAPPRIYVVGGGVFIPFSHNQVYDPKTDTWTVGASMPTARTGLAIAVLDDRLYAIGGGWYPISTTDANEIYTPIGYNTSQPSPSPTPDTTKPTPTSTKAPTPTPTQTPTTPPTTHPTTSPTQQPNSSPSKPAPATPTATTSDKDSDGQANTYWVAATAVLVAAGALAAVLLKKKHKANSKK
ncbi:MAG: hypothetical protein NWF05_06710 [Candidatus Bathyarchaeota archaeon]|nr:hypothetical protein [Candidatus Bathyarchaeota archaeon]